MTKTNVPRLRFSEFSGGWKEKKLGSLVNYEQPTKYIVKSTEYNDNYETPVLTAGKSFILGYSNEKNIKRASSKSPVIVFDDFTTGNHFVDFSFMVKSSAIKILKANDGNLTYFINCVLNNITYAPVSHNRQWISKYSNFLIHVPLFKEQEKIVFFFKKQDKLIELQTQKVDQLKKLKRGYLQKMFPQEGETVPRLRFSRFSGEWEEKTLSDIGIIKGGSSFPESEQGNKSGTPFFKVSDLSLNIKVMNKSSNYVDNNQIIKNKWKPLKPCNGSIIFAKVGAALFKNRKRLVNQTFMIDNNLMAFLINDKNNINYFYYLFETFYLPKYAQIGALPSISSKDICDMKFLCAFIDEQQKIGDFFAKLDKLIEEQSNKLDQLKQQKKAYLQKMFI